MHFDPASLVAAVTALFSVGGQSTSTVTRCDTISGTSSCNTFVATDERLPPHRPHTCFANGQCVTFDVGQMVIISDKSTVTTRDPRIPLQTDTFATCKVLTNAAGQTSTECFGGLQLTIPPSTFTVPGESSVVSCLPSPNDKTCHMIPASSVSLHIDPGATCTVLTNKFGQHSTECFVLTTPTSTPTKPSTKTTLPPSSITHGPEECTVLTNAAGQTSLECFGPAWTPITTSTSHRTGSPEPEICTVLTNAAGQTSEECFGSSDIAAPPTTSHHGPKPRICTTLTNALGQKSLECFFEGPTPITTPTTITTTGTDGVHTHILTCKLLTNALGQVSNECFGPIQPVPPTTTRSDPQHTGPVDSPLCKHPTKLTGPDGKQTPVCLSGVDGTGVPITARKDEL